LTKSTAQVQSLLDKLVAIEDRLVALLDWAETHDVSDLTIAKVHFMLNLSRGMIPTLGWVLGIEDQGPIPDGFLSVEDYAKEAHVFIEGAYRAREPRPRES